ncbi:MAG TPA: ferredoxin-thioredoxin reductase catalytic domain-containing protein [Anaerolineae bacterium]|nr:ferredoxin-thioredoxin reductase catalytic domain-containing protein [Anaerolineae bacterium]HQH39800.1 ferredoxin-thioredoxin reductase catalytic domain-containing protein [Anaerolineae bacterium]
MSGVITPEQIEQLYQQLDREARAGAYNLNPDTSFTLGLVESLLINTARYGYRACPCRLADGVRARDLDIICPCDYRDPDLNEYGTCFCALYVSDAVRDGQQELTPVPERRPPGGPTASATHEEELVDFTHRGIPVWRCKVCGYLCARPEPPLKCPICKADKDRFERFA